MNSKVIKQYETSCMMYGHMCTWNLRKVINLYI